MTHGRRAGQDESGGRGRIRRIAGGLLRVVRDGWLIIGITFLMFAGLEGSYRWQSRLRERLRDRAEQAESAGNRIAHPFEGEPWFGYNGPVEGGGRQFDAYRVWWPKPLGSRYLNIDSAGRRVTGPPLTRPARARVFMLGGSTMYGWNHIDSLTIPAMLRRNLDATGEAPVEVLNYAQTGYTLTQGLITLMLEIRRGNVPDAAVFFDGNNEIAPVWATGRPGSISNEDLAGEAWTLGRRGFREELFGLARHSRVLRRIRVALGEPAFVAPARPSPDACGEIGAEYRNLVKQGIAIGDAFGIDVVFYFQPILATSRKVRTAWEESVKGPPEYDELVRRCAAVSDSLLADEMGRHYVPLHGLFDADTASQFTDDWGHLTVHGNERVARVMAERLAPLLEARAGGRRGTDRNR